MYDELFFGSSTSGESSTILTNKFHFGLLMFVVGIAVTLCRDWYWI